MGDSDDSTARARNGYLGQTAFCVNSGVFKLFGSRAFEILGSSGFFVWALWKVGASRSETIDSGRKWGNKTLSVIWVYDELRFSIEYPMEIPFLAVLDLAIWLKIADSPP